jgi:hypothetical protein
MLSWRATVMRNALNKKMEKRLIREIISLECVFPQAAPIALSAATLTGRSARIGIFSAGTSRVRFRLM